MRVTVASTAAGCENWLLDLDVDARTTVAELKKILAAPGPKCGQRMATDFDECQEQFYRVFEAGNLDLRSGTDIIVQLGLFDSCVIHGIQLSECERTEFVDSTTSQLKVNSFFFALAKIC